MATTAEIMERRREVVSMIGDRSRDGRYFAESAGPALDLQAPGSTWEAALTALIQALVGMPVANEVGGSKLLKAFLVRVQVV